MVQCVDVIDIENKWTFHSYSKLSLHILDPQTLYQNSSTQKHAPRLRQEKYLINKRKYAKL